MGYRHLRTFLLIAGLVAWAGLGCAEEEASVPRFRGPTPPGVVKPGESSIAARERAARGTGLVEKAPPGASGEGTITVQTLSETDFIASPTHRDPFRVFYEVLREDGDQGRPDQREIKLKEFDIADLRLIGIVTNIGDPRAMVVTPEGTGFVLRRGDYVGRADYVDTGSGGERIQVNWRVARVHGSGREEERGVYLVRDDPTTPTEADITRFMPLHPRD